MKTTYDYQNKSISDLNGSSFQQSINSSFKQTRNNADQSQIEGKSNSSIIQRLRDKSSNNQINVNNNGRSKQSQQQFMHHQTSQLDSINDSQNYSQSFDSVIEDKTMIENNNLGRNGIQDDFLGGENSSIQSQSIIQYSKRAMDSNKDSARLDNKEMVMSQASNSNLQERSFFKQISGISSSPGKKKIVLKQSYTRPTRPPTAQEIKQSLQANQNETSFNMIDQNQQSINESNSIAKKNNHHILAQQRSEIRSQKSQLRYDLNPSMKTDGDQQYFNQQKSNRRADIKSNNDEDIFNSIFDTMKDSLSNDKPPINEAEFFKKNDYFKDEKYEQVEQLYDQKISSYRQKFEVTRNIIEQRKQRIIKQKKYLEDMMTSFEIKAELEAQLALQKLIKKGYDQAWNLVQNWIFSIITDQEKCMRYALMKTQKQLDFVSQQKLAYQESKTLKTIEGLQMKNEVQQMVAQSMNTKASQVQFEHLATIRLKPTYKSPSTTEINYKINSASTKLTSINGIIKNSNEIIDTASEIMQQEMQRFKVKDSQQHITSINQSQIVLNTCLRIFQDPELTSKDQRVFVDSIEALNVIISGEKNKKSPQLTKLQQEAKQFTHLIDKQKNGSNNQFVFQQEQCQIKRIKISNQLKIQLDTNNYSLLNECQVKHLLKSNIFNKYFDNDFSTKDSSQLIHHFYIIEENSIFSSEQSNNNNKNPQRILPKDRKVKHIRRLYDYEVLFLLFSFLKPASIIHSIEVRFQTEAIKKLQLLNTLDRDRTNSDMMVSATKSKDLTKFYLIDHYDAESMQIIKQSLIKATANENNKKEMPQVVSTNHQVYFCHFPNSSIQMTPSSATQQVYIPHSSSTRKRPESGNKSQKDMKTVKKLTRLPIALEMDISDSVYLRFIKKFKLLKEKSTKNLGGGPGNISANNSIQEGNNNNGGGIQNRGSLGTRKESSQLILCNYHSDLEKFIQVGMNINLVPMMLIPNSFQKAIRNYEFWKDEIKSSLAFDVLVDTGKGNFLKENIHKIFNFAVNMKKMQQPNVQGFLDCMKLQPPTINFLEAYYSWISKVIQHQRDIYVKNSQFVEYNGHFIQQLSQFNQNLKQAVENEIYIIDELKKWQSEVSKQYLKDIFHQIVEIVISKDVIIKFQQFQQMNERLNQLRQHQQMLINKQLLQTQQQQDAGRQLPKINDQNNNISNLTRPPIGNNTFSNGFVTKQDSFNKGQSNVIEKLTSIYGGVAAVHYGPTQKKSANVILQNSEISAGNRLIGMIENNKEGSQIRNHNPVGSGQQQQMLQRKYSAGSKKDFSLPLAQSEGSMLQNSMNLKQQQFENQISSKLDEYYAANLINPINAQPSSLNTSHQQLIYQPNNANSYFSSQQLGPASQISGTPSHTNIIQSSPLSKSLYKVPFQQQIQVNQKKQRASSAYKNRQSDHQMDQYQIQNTMMLPQQTSLPRPYSNVYDNNLQSQYNIMNLANNNQSSKSNNIGITVANTFQNPPPKFPINVFTTQQQQLQQIYNTKVNRPVQPPPMMTQVMSTAPTGSTSHQGRQQKNLDKQQTIVMTYSNAVPRISSANADKDRRKMGQTFYGGEKKKSKKSSNPLSKIGSNNSNTNSERKEIKLNNFLKLQ